MITGLTAQNTLGVQGVHEVPPEFVLQQVSRLPFSITSDARFACRLLIVFCSAEEYS